MKLENLLNKSCLIGLQYFDAQGELLQQNQIAGTVVHVDNENGISIKLASGSSDPKPESATIASDADHRAQRDIFLLPPNTRTWFHAPKGDYRDENKKLLMKDPDYLVTWEIHKTQKDKQGEHEWWEWVIPSSAPSVN